MHRFLRIAGGVSLFALAWSTAALAGSTADLSGVSLVIEPAVCAATPAPVLFAAHDTGRFCDSTATHGTSASCKTEARTQGLLTCQLHNFPHR